MAGGLGSEALGDPLGGGGPIHVVRAQAIEGQTVRVVFDAEPLHQSAVSPADALNPSNYQFAVTVGAGTGAPQPVGVKVAVVEGPTLAVPAGHWGVDVQVDRPLVVGLSFEVTVATQVRSANGGTLGFPYSAPFVGIVRLAAVQPPPRQLENLDLGNNIVTGAFIVEDGGDIAPQGGLEGYRKRVIRRVTTPKNAWAHLPGYGLLPGLKMPASSKEILALKADAVQQIGSEPETASVDVQVSFAAQVLTMSIKARTKTGLTLVLGVAQSAAGVVIT